MTTDEIPAMPTEPAPWPHRDKISTNSFGLTKDFACVAKPIPRKEIEGNAKAEQAMNDEWDRLISKGVWSYDCVREWSEVASTARRNGKTVHLGRIFGLMVLKGSELPEGHPLQKHKY